MKCFILMTTNGDKYRYVLTESDYELGGFAEISVMDFVIDSVEEAMEIKGKLVTYAKSKGDDFTKFFIWKL